jgi:oxygen-independent coproporphyrinogen-3 oxidase
VTAPLWQAGDPAVGLYVHVPFCRAICTYCAFAKGEYDPALADAWLEGLEREIAVREESTWSERPLLDTIFLGGGTPSTLTPEQWSRLGRLLRRGFEILPGVEFTSEANPESLDEGTAAAMREAGVNRLSLGVQSLDPGELAALGRIHGTAEVEQAVATAHAAGFDNLNLDLMYGLPGQTLARFEASLEGVLRLAPDHVSAYCLALEPGTPLAEDVATGRTVPPEDDTARRQYDRLGERMEATGFGLYEISNFARPGRACRHNLRYWRREDVIALGPSSHALLGGYRWVNPAPLERWRDAYREAARAPRPAPVPKPQARFEWVFLHLRLAAGFAEDAFGERWGDSFPEVYGAVSERLVRLGLLQRDDGWVRLSPSARFVSDGVFSEFAPEP